MEDSVFKCCLGRENTQQSLVVDVDPTGFLGTHVSIRILDPSGSDMGHVYLSRGALRELADELTDLADELEDDGEEVEETPEFIY